jgi:hypothetical protein
MTALRPRADPTFVAAACGLLLLVARLDLVPALRGPAPWPPEWQWTAAPVPLGPGACAAIALVAVAAVLVTRRSTRGSGVAALVLGALVPYGMLAPAAHPLRETLERTVDGAFTSYHKVATTSRGNDAWRYLRDHRDLQPGMRGVPHAATHPPGPVLHYRAWAALGERHPGLARATTDLVRRLGVEPGALRTPQTEAGTVSAFLGSFTLALLAGLSALSAAALAARLGSDAVVAARIGLLVPLLPGMALMTPELDQALALPVTLSAVLLAGGLAQPWRAAAAGAVVGLATFFSYGVPLLAALTCTALLLALAPDRATALRAVALASLAAAVTFLLPLLAGHDPVGSLRQGLEIHRVAFTAPRSRALWAAWNPLDVALFLGLPLVVTLARGAPGEPPVLARFRRTLGALTLLFLVSGLVRGEAGRIALPLFPALAVASAPAWCGTARGAAALAVLLGVIGLGLRLSWQLP